MSGREHRARRRAEFGQHFLRSRGLAARLVSHSSITSQDLVVEIGGGTGILTAELACRCGRLVAVEADHILAQQLRREFGALPHVEVIEQDFLRFVLPKVPHKIFGSIPYNLTASIMRKITDARVPPDDAYLVVQKEAAERFAGTPYAPETLQSLLLKPWWHTEILFRLRKTDFSPPPSVDSVMLWLAHRTRSSITSDEAPEYRRFISESFGKRGHTVRKCLRWAFTGRQINRLSRDLRFDQGAPPSELTFDQWLGLFRYRWIGDAVEVT